jgi:PAS domain-containing protein
VRLVTEGQRPLQLIHARNLMTGLSTPAFLVDADGIVVFYNDAAGALLGRRFEEGGQLSPERWGTEVGPLDDEGRPIPWEELPLTVALRRNRPALGRFRIRALDGREHEIHVTAIPIVTMSGTHGAMAIFWSLDDEEA